MELLHLLVDGLGTRAFDPVFCVFFVLKRCAGALGGGCCTAGDYYLNLSGAQTQRILIPIYCLIQLCAAGAIILFRDTRNPHWLRLVHMLDLKVKVHVPVHVEELLA